jgi:hypothetical protein
LPVSPERDPWRLAADTAQAPPSDCRAPGQELPLDIPTGYAVEARSSVVLVADRQ